MKNKLLLEFDSKENFKQKFNSLKINLNCNPAGWFWRLVKAEPYDYVKYQTRILNMEEWGRENLNYPENNSSWKNLYACECMYITVGLGVAIFFFRIDAGSVGRIMSNK